MLDDKDNAIAFLAESAENEAKRRLLLAQDGIISMLHCRYLLLLVLFDDEDDEDDGEESSSILISLDKAGSYSAGSKMMQEVIMMIPKYI